jgi:hypothetical protein
MKIKIFFTIILVITLSVISIYSYDFFKIKNIEKDSYLFVSSNTYEVDLYNLEQEKETTIIRGSKVLLLKKSDELYKIKYNNKEYYINKNNLEEDINNVVKEQYMYVRTPVTINGEEKLYFAPKGSKLKVISHDELNIDGSVLKYEIEYNNQFGYVYSKYLSFNEEEALKHYDYDNSYQVHLKRTNTLGGGSAGNLDFYPFKKDKIENNDMPDEVRSLYLNSAAIRNVDNYITFAKANNINAFVVDIKDNTSPAYKSKVMEKYSPTNYKYGLSSLENYKEYINKLKENGFYVIGRITIFKDSYYVNDHKESAILDKATREPFRHNGSYWPSAFNRDVWKFNVELAKEAVIEMGFNEIQFDYVRFPDRTLSLELNNKIDFNNTYNEDKASAIQNFLIYAFDELRSVNAYISADVFGESAHTYVTGYGQYWGAISNVVDVISPMPYPDHFGAYEYGFTVPVWTVPYDVLSYWGKNFVLKRQQEIPTPAVVRTWIQAYDSITTPSVIYDKDKIYDQIKALRDSNLSGGYMTWNAGSSLARYEFIKEAFSKE